MSREPATKPASMNAGDALERARGVVEYLRSAGPRIEAARALPADVIEQLNRARMFRLLLPRTLGGDELHLKTHAQVMETIAGADASVAWCMGQGGGCAMSSAFLRPDVSKRFFGPAEAALAWGAGIQGRAVAVDGGYRVSGKWTFASGTSNATLLGGHSYVFEKDGKTPRRHPDGSQVDRTAIFWKSKATIHDVWHTIGLKGTASYSYEINDVFVPEEETIDRDDFASLHEKGTLYLFPTTQAYAAGFSALMLGIAQAMVGDLKTLALTKAPRGAASSLKDSAVFHAELAQLEARVRACRAYLHGTIDEVWDEVDRTRVLTLQRRADFKLATTWVINQGVEIAKDAYRAAGNTAVFQSNPFEHRLRDAFSASQQTQGRPSNFITIGRVLMGLEPDTTMFL
jgi:indole-3-acetate monooxygenase